MSLYTGDLTVGQGNLTYLDNIDMYVENDASTIANAAASAGLAAGDQTGIMLIAGNTTEISGADYTHAMYLPLQSGETASPSFELRDVRMHWTFQNQADHQGTPIGGTPLCLAALRWTNVDIFSTAPAGTTTSVSWGIFNNGSGALLPVFDGDGHITTPGTAGGRGRTRPINWENVNIFGSGGLRILINGADPRTSTFTNVNFYPDATAGSERGAFGELPYVPFAGASFGNPFFRDDLPSITQSIWMRQTGGPLRSNLGITTNWLPHPQHNLVGMAGADRSMAVDGGVWVFLINPIYAPDVSNLSIVGGQGATTGNPSRFTSCGAWNPTTNAADIKYNLSSVGMRFAIPTAYTGGSTDPGVRTIPTLLTDTVNTQPANGFFIVHNNGEFESPGGNQLDLAQLQTRAIPMVSYTHQINTLIGGVFDNQVGATTNVPGIGQDIGADLVFATADNYEFVEDLFLAGRASTDTSQIINADQFWPALKGVIYEDPANANFVGVDRLRVIPTASSIQFLDRVEMAPSRITTPNDGTPNNAIVLNTSSTNLNTSVVNEFIFLEADGTTNTPVFWTAADSDVLLGQTFTDPITIRGGMFNTGFPRTFDNGATLAGDIVVTRPTVDNLLYDFTNVTIAPGSTITFLGDAQIRIRGASATEQASQIFGPNGTTGAAAEIEYEAAIITNILRIPTPANGRLNVFNETRSVEIVPTQDISSGGGTLQFTLSTDPSAGSLNGFAAGNTINVFVKYDSDIVGGTYYQEQRYQLVFSAVDGAVLTYDPIEVSSILTADGTVPANTAIRVQERGIIDGVNYGTVFGLYDTRDISAGLNITNASGGQIGLAAMIGNLDEYFDLWLAEALLANLAPLISYGQGNLVTFIRDHITLGSANQADGTEAAAGFTGNRIQHTVQNFTPDSSVGVGVVVSNGYSEVLLLIANLTAVDPAQIRAAIDSSVVATSVEAILVDTSTTLDTAIAAINTTVGVINTSTTVPTTGNAADGTLAREIQLFQQNEKTKPGPLAGRITFPRDGT